MTRKEVEHHVETVLGIAEGVINLHTSAIDFENVYVQFLAHLRDRANEELDRTNALLEAEKTQEARAEYARDWPENF